MRVSRVTIGRDVRVIEDARDHLWLEGAVRLCPGQRVTLIGEGQNDRSRVRQVVVVSWTVAHVGAEGLVYRGACRPDG